MATNPEPGLARLGLKEIESHTLPKRALIHALPKGTIFENNGYQSGSLYIVLEGRVKAFVLDSNGQEKDLSYHGTGD